MLLNLRSYGLCIVIVSVLGYAATAHATSQLTLTGADGQSMALQATTIESAAAAECSISYEPSILSNPRVELGALATGAMMAVNTQTPGLIRVALIRTTPMMGNGVIASVLFDRTSSSVVRDKVLHCPADGYRRQAASRNCSGCGRRNSSADVRGIQSRPAGNHFCSRCLARFSSRQTSGFSRRASCRTKKEQGRGSKAG